MKGCRCILFTPPTANTAEVYHLYSGYLVCRDTFHGLELLFHLGPLRFYHLRVYAGRGIDTILVVVHRGIGVVGFQLSVASPLVAVDDRSVQHDPLDDRNKGLCLTVRNKLHVANTGCRRCVTHPKHPLVRHKLHVADTFNVVAAGLSRSRRSRTPNTDSPKRFDFGTCLASASSSSDGSLNSPPGSWSCNCRSNTITKRCIMISSASTVKVSSSESCCSKSSLYIASLWASISSNNLSSL